MYWTIFIYCFNNIIKKKNVTLSKTKQKRVRNVMGIYYLYVKGNGTNFWLLFFSYHFDKNKFLVYHSSACVVFLVLGNHLLQIDNFHSIVKGCHFTTSNFVSKIFVNDRAMTM